MGRRPRKHKQGVSRSREEPHALRYEHAFLFVHGIGNHKRASTLHGMGRPVYETLREVYGPEQVQWASLPDEPGAAAEIVFSVAGEEPKRVLLLESWWAGQVSRASSPPSVAPLWWAFRTLLLLLPLLLAPGQREQRAHELISYDPKSWREWIRYLWSTTAVASGLLWRLGVIILAITGLGWALGLLADWTAWWVPAALLVALVGAAAAWLVWVPSNLPNYVRLVVTDPVLRETIRSVLAASIDRAAQLAPGVTIVAHSQGGYLAHDLLARGGGQKTSKVQRLVAVGSGLKPITALVGLQAPRLAVPVFAGLVAAALIWAGLLWLGSPGLVLSVPILTAWMQAAFAGLIVPWSLPTIWTSAQFGELATFSGVASSLLASVPGILLVAAGVALTWWGMWFRTRGQEEIRPIADIGGKRFTWQEWSTGHDVVGRMMFPELPDRARYRVVPGSGHALLDHGSSQYFKRGSVLRLELAALVLQHLGLRSASDRWRAIGQESGNRLLAGSDRRHRLRGMWLGVYALLAIALPFTILGVSVSEAFMATWSLAMFLAVMMSVAVALSNRSQRRREALRVTRALRAEQTDTPRTRSWDRVPATHRAAAVILLLLSVLAFGGGLALAALSQYDRYDPAVHGMAGASIWFLGIISGFTAAGWIAGYRVRWWLGCMPALMLLGIWSQLSQAGLYFSPLGVFAPGVLFSAMLLAVQVSAIVLVACSYRRIASPVRKPQ